MFNRAHRPKLSVPLVVAGRFGRAQGLVGPFDRPIVGRFLLVGAISIGALGCTQAELEPQADVLTTEAGDSIVLTPPETDPAGERFDPSDRVVDIAGRYLSGQPMSIAMGAEFNTAYVAAAFRASGLSRGEAVCSADAFAEGFDGFASVELSTLAGSLGSVPTAVLGCVDPARIGEISEQGTSTDFSLVPITEIRGLLGDLLVAQFARLGLNDTEATCASFEVIVQHAPDDHRALFVGIDVAEGELQQTLSKCLR